METRSPTRTGTAPLLEISELVVSVAGVLEGSAEHGAARVVDGVSFSMRAGETLALVGESGSGKSLTALSIMGLLPEQATSMTGGSIRFEGRSLTDMSPQERRLVRGRRIGMVFQEIMTALNPVLRIGAQVAEALRHCRGLRAGEARRQAISELERVGIPDPVRCARSYPHQLSGGMRQRVGLAMAVCANPALLIADEPTTALDVTVQSQILDLIDDLKRETGMAVLLITHDLGIVAEVADRVAVMYAGRIVERASVLDLFRGARHPYTRGLLASLPELAQPGTRLPAIPGVVPAPGQLPSGCSFRDRCAFAQERCALEDPVLSTVMGPGTACHYPVEDATQ